MQGVKPEKPSLSHWTLLLIAVLIPSLHQAAPTNPQRNRVVNSDATHEVTLSTTGELEERRAQVLRMRHRRMSEGQIARALTARRWQARRVASRVASQKSRVLTGCEGTGRNERPQHLWSLDVSLC
jgi:hypothetical protein